MASARRWRSSAPSGSSARARAGGRTRRRCARPPSRAPSRRDRPPSGNMSSRGTSPRTRSASPRSNARVNASSRPSHDPSNRRVCVQANCHGIARSVLTPRSPPSRRAGRLPMVNSSSSGAGRGRAEVVEKRRMLVHVAAIQLARVSGEPLHALAPLRLRRRRRQQPRLERPGRVDLHRPQRDVGQAEQRLDHFSLLGHAQRAVDRSGGLRLQRVIGGPAAAADAAAAAVKQRDADAMTAAGGDDALPGPCTAPSRR